MSADQKYIVFKQSDVREFMLPWNIALTDAVVIRTKDIFAGPGLSSYAMSIQTALDLNALMDGGVFTLAQKKRLAEVRDYFFERAQEAFAKATADEARVPD